MFYVIEQDGTLQWEVSDEFAIPSGMLYTTIVPPIGMVRPKLVGTDWVDIGEVVYVPTKAELEIDERLWRNIELSRADIELNKVQDGVGTGTVTVWRQYRVDLRNWPESPLFPDSKCRPASPDRL